MGKLDNRCSAKMRRRKAQAKKKARLERRKIANAKTPAKTTKKKAKS